MRRRDLFAAMAASGLAPASAAPAQDSGGKLKISAVEFWRMEGRRETVVGINNQYQANAIHIYEEQRPRCVFRGMAIGVPGACR